MRVNLLIFKMQNPDIVCFENSVDSHCFYSACKYLIITRVLQVDNFGGVHNIMGLIVLKIFIWGGKLYSQKFSFKATCKLTTPISQS